MFTQGIRRVSLPPLNSVEEKRWGSGGIENDRQEKARDFEDRG